MSAVVYIRLDKDDPIESANSYAARHVPDANHAEVDSNGYLRLWSDEGWGKSDCGLFKDWDHVVIEPRRLRDSNGRFRAKEPR